MLFGVTELKPRRPKRCNNSILVHPDGKTCLTGLATSILFLSRDPKEIITHQHHLHFSNWVHWAHCSLSFQSRFLLLFPWHSFWNPADDPGCLKLKNPASIDRYIFLIVLTGKSSPIVQALYYYGNVCPTEVCVTEWSSLEMALFSIVVPCRPLLPELKFFTGQTNNTGVKMREG